VHRMGADPTPSLCPYTTLFRSEPFHRAATGRLAGDPGQLCPPCRQPVMARGPGSRPVSVIFVYLYNARLPIVAARCGGSCRPRRSEEHTSELQSRENLVCRLLL